MASNARPNHSLMHVVGCKIQVAFPGVLGLTDAEVGYIHPPLSTSHQRSTSAPPRSRAADMRTLAQESMVAVPAVSATFTADTDIASKLGEAGNTIDSSFRPQPFVFADDALL